MTSTTRSFIFAMFTVALAAVAPYAVASDVDDLKQQLHEFLAGASVGDADVHDNFWAEELIYTSSRGTRTNKAEIMEGMRSSSEADADGDAPSVIYTAEDIDVQVYGDTAVIAFRLVGTPQGDNADAPDEYFNTGTYLKRDGEWRVIAWQATIIPKPVAGD